MNQPVLPEYSSLDIQALSRVFKKTTNSYKCLWTLALLENLSKKECPDRIDCLSMYETMIEKAEDPVERFKMSLGSRDEIGKFLSADQDEVEHELPPRMVAEPQATYKAVKNKSSLYATLGKYVPQRWLTPFFEKSLRGLPDYKKDNVIRKLAKERFLSNESSPYRIEGSGNEMQIIVHPIWKEYFRQNFKILESWARWHWVCYLQARNPSIPGIVNKIDKPLVRQSLDNERQVWKEIIGHLNGVRCIYSGELLTGNAFDLDHYVPWSFVGHNEPWNLIPVMKAVNSSKNDELPSDKYFKRFVYLQHKAIGIAIEHEISRWEKRWKESYMFELRLSSSDLRNHKRLSEAYHKLLSPQLELAAQKGFSKNWEYKNYK